jgi:hypothetical protein
MVVMPRPSASAACRGVIILRFLALLSPSCGIISTSGDSFTLRVGTKSPSSPLPSCFFPSTHHSSAITVPDWPKPWRTISVHERGSLREPYRTSGGFDPPTYGRIGGACCSSSTCCRADSCPRRSRTACRFLARWASRPRRSAGRPPQAGREAISELQPPISL